MAEKLAALATSPADYARFGLSPTTIAPWEDGARTDGSADSGVRFSSDRLGALDARGLDLTRRFLAG